MSSPQEPGPDDPVTLAELAAFHGGDLSAKEEERLRMRIERDPEASAKLKQLEDVDLLFEPAPAIDIPPDMPPAVAARLQAMLADEALKRVEAAEAAEAAVAARRHDPGTPD